MAEIDALTARLDDLAVTPGGERAGPEPDDAARGRATRPARTRCAAPRSGPRRCALLVASGRDALHYRDWFDLLTRAGHAVAGKDPLAVFLTQITRSPPAQGRAARRIRPRPPGARATLQRRLDDLNAAPRDPAPATTDLTELRTRRAQLTAEISQAREGARGGAGGMTIRPATAADAEQVAAIYNHGIEERQATFETRPRRPNEVVGWLEERRPVPGRRPTTTAILGFARVSAYSTREAYAGVGEHAVYVSPGRTRPQRRLHAAGRARGRRRTGGLPQAHQPRLHDQPGQPGRCTARPASRRSASSAATAQLDGEWKDTVLVERLLGEAARLRFRP